VLWCCCSCPPCAPTLLSQERVLWSWLEGPHPTHLTAISIALCVCCCALQHTHGPPIISCCMEMWHALMIIHMCIVQYRIVLHHIVFSGLRQSLDLLLEVWLFIGKGGRLLCNARCLGFLPWPHLHWYSALACMRKCAAVDVGFKNSIVGRAATLWISWTPDVHLNPSPGLAVPNHYAPPAWG